MPADADTAARTVAVGVELGFVLRTIQLCSWLVFFLAWMQIGRGDWLHQKIRNSYLKFWGKFFVLAYPVMLALSVLGHKGLVAHFLVWSYYPALAAHLGLSFAAAMTLWFLRIWPAGDAKLFFLLALAFPLMGLPGSFHSGMRFFEVLINTFVPATVVLFLLSLEYIWRTRFKSQKLFLGSLGPRRELDFFREQSREAWRLFKPLLIERLGRALAFSRNLWRTARVRGIRSAADLLRWGVSVIGNPGAAAAAVFDWLFSMILMSLVTYYLGSIVGSALLRTTFMFVLFFVWSRMQQFLGQVWSLLLGSAVFAAALLRSPEFDYGQLLVAFANISVFSLAIRLGMGWTLRVLAGRVVLVFLSIGGLAAFPFIDYVLEPVVNILLLPLLQFLVGLVPWGIIGGIEALKSFSASAAAWADAAVQVDFEAFSSLVGWTLEGTVLTWAAMGLFFGLAMVFARIWDLESFESVDAGRIAPQMLLAPALIERLKEDEEFFEENFSDLYADGLTPDQVEALKRWCAEHSVASVPLAPTLSFASWIFAGYLLTAVIDGHLLKFVF